jgi:hypothetical protein
MHVRDRGFSVGGRGVEDVGDAAVGHELLVHGHLELGDGAVGAEDFAQVRRVHVFGEFFYHDFGGARGGWTS